MLKFLLCLSGLLLVAASLEELDLKELTEDDQAEVSPKINWRPVWQEQTQLESNPNFARHCNDADLSDRSETELFNNVADELSEEDTTAERMDNVCNASDNRGVHRLLRKSRALMPVERLQNILANAAAADTELRNLGRLMRTDEFREKLATLRATNEHRIVHEYACHRLHINYERYIDFVRVFLDIHTNAIPMSGIANPRPGIRGLLQDLTDALPSQQIRTLYRELLETDQELATSLHLIRSSQFRLLLKNYRNCAAYLEVKLDLEAAGVPMRAVIQLVDTAIGWQNADIGAETTILSI